MAKAENLTNEQLSLKLQDVLENWPLYRELMYSGSEASFLPEEISYFCENIKCKKEQLWKRDEYSYGSGGDKGVKTCEYVCRNCGSSHIRYFYLWLTPDEQSWSFVKIGQYPPVQKEPPKRLASNLDQSDLDLYRKALTSRNNAYGLGALAYLRRVVENRMNDLLDLVQGQIADRHRPRLPHQPRNHDASV